MSQSFEQQKNRKAFLYTIIVCGAILLLSLIISWKIMPPPKPIVQDLIEINLGNDEEGFGDEQPLIKGEPGKAESEVAAADVAPAKNDETPVESFEDNTKDEAVSVPKVPKPIVKTTPSTKPPVTSSITKPVAATNAPIAPKPQKPKLIYNGNGAGTGNNADEDNGFRSQGKKPGGTGDIGSPSGDKDSYGNAPSGRTGGPKVINGGRKVIRYYSYTGDLPKATIFAQVNVSPEGKGSFVKLVKPSTSFSASYANAVSNYLKTIQFDKATTASTVVVRFNFEVN